MRRVAVGTTLASISKKAERRRGCSATTNESARTSRVESTPCGCTRIGAGKRRALPTQVHLCNICTMTFTNTERAMILGVSTDLARLSEMLKVMAGERPVDEAALRPAVDLVVPDEGTQPERVLAYIRQCQSGCARAALREAFPELNDNSLSGAITRLKDRGLIETVGRGRYRARRGFPSRR